jgi:hypothetical protein
MAMNIHQLMCIPLLYVSSKLILDVYLSDCDVTCDVRCQYRGLQKKGVTNEFFHGFNVIAYFDKWDDRSGKHYLPSNIQKVLQSRVSEFFYE